MKSLEGFIRPLEIVRQQMGANSAKGENIVLDPVDIVLGKGVFIDYPHDTGVGPGGIITYDGKPVVIYIQDTGHSQGLLKNTPEKSKKVHVAECSTLARMRREGRSERYIATTRDSGLFCVHYRNDDGATGEMDAALVICHHCFQMVGGTGSKDCFSFKKHLETHGSKIVHLPPTRDTDGRQSDYTDDWNGVSMQSRRQANWTCSGCQVNLETAQYCLHVHHRNGVKSDNQPANLQVLCALCHQDQNGHGGMHIKHADRAAILAARRMQQADSMR